MDPISVAILLKTSVSLYKAAVVQYQKRLTFKEVLEWFQSRNNLVASDNVVAFTLQEKLKDGKYKVVQGIFNTQTGSIIDNRILESDKVDHELAEVHRDHELVLYT